MNTSDWIREAVPNLTEDEEYRGPVQEPPTKKLRTLAEDTQHHLALEVSTCLHTHRGTDTQRQREEQTPRHTERNRDTQRNRDIIKYNLMKMLAT